QIIWNVLRQPMRRALEALVMERRAGDKAAFPFEHELFDRARTRWHAAGRAGEAARALLTGLRVRRIAVPDDPPDPILAEQDPARLERWHERAILAATTAEVLDEPS